MRIERFDGGGERRALIGMITSHKVLRALAPLCKDSPLPSRWGNLIASWCVKFCAKHNRAPGRAIEGLYGAWRQSREGSGDTETANALERFLDSISDEYENSEPIPDDHLIEQGQTLLLKTSLVRLKDALEGDLTSGEIQKALQRVKGFDAREIGNGTFYDLLRDEEGLRQALEIAQRDPLIVMPGDAHVFFGRSLERDQFVACLSPDKRGKSTWLLDFAWRAMKQRRMTLFYAAGDMGRAQMHGRFAARACNRPIRPTTVRYPTAISKLDGQQEEKRKGFKVEHVERKWTDHLSYEEAWSQYQGAIERYVRDDRPCLEMACYPAGSLTVSMIRDECHRRAEDGRPVDVVVIDYADLMDSPAHKEIRDRTNAVWTGLRALASEYQLLVLTATQSNAEAYRKRSLDIRNFSEDKRKNAHVSGMFGLNQEPEEKSQGLIRLNWLHQRESDYDSGRFLGVAGCAALSRPLIKSLW